MNATTKWTGLAGLVAGEVNRLSVGVGMMPRGEVGLIFLIEPPLRK